MALTATMNEDNGAARHHLRFDGIPEAWHLGLPVGNGEIGAMVWGQGGTLILTLDSYQVWESRTWEPDAECNYEYLRQLVRDRRFDEIDRKYFAPRKTQYATRLPIGRFELDLKQPLGKLSCTLDLMSASVRIQGAAPDGRPVSIRNAGRPSIAEAGSDAEVEAIRQGGTVVFATRQGGAYRLRWRGDAD